MYSFIQIFTVIAAMDLTNSIVNLNRAKSVSYIHLRIIGSLQFTRYLHNPLPMGPRTCFFYPFDFPFHDVQKPTFGVLLVGAFLAVGVVIAQAIVLTIVTNWAAITHVRQIISNAPMVASFLIAKMTVFQMSWFAMAFQTVLMGKMKRNLVAS